MPDRRMDCSAGSTGSLVCLEYSTQFMPPEELILLEFRTLHRKRIFSERYAICCIANAGRLIYFASDPKPATSWQEPTNSRFQQFAAYTVYSQASVGSLGAAASSSSSSSTKTGFTGITGCGASRSQTGITKIATAQARITQCDVWSLGQNEAGVGVSKN